VDLYILSPFYTALTSTPIFSISSFIFSGIPLSVIKMLIEFIGVTEAKFRLPNLEWSVRATTL